MPYSSSPLPPIALYSKMFSVGLVLINDNKIIQMFNTAIFTKTTLNIKIHTNLQSVVVLIVQRKYQCLNERDKSNPRACQLYDL